MTQGHRHRRIVVSRSGLVHRALTRPTLWVTSNEQWAESSRLVFGPTRDGRWRLSPLGLAHSLFGLTLVVR